ncbi:MAG: hypothetical protein M1835_005234 [Candelina submexicana]|nr:MAG: hypothetical protein M1835_005234 [Candelina submexicana]
MHHSVKVSIFVDEPIEGHLDITWETEEHIANWVMTDLLHIIPTFSTSSYTHLLPSLEKNLITTVDLLTLDALEIAKRAQLPPLDVRRLINAVIAALHGELGLSIEAGDGIANDDALPSTQKPFKEKARLNKTGSEVVEEWQTISTLDKQLDAALGGGIPTGYITEITGESGAGKTQFLLTLLLSAQLPTPDGQSRPTLYISTEAPLSTPRLSQFLSSHPILNTLPPTIPPPSLSRILTLQTPDLESQDHILRYQLPVALTRHKIRLVILDSVAANYRAEFERPDARSGASMGKRSNELAKLGQLLRDLARIHNVAIVVANQVADRFTPATPTMTRGPPRPPASGMISGPPSSPLVSRSNIPPLPINGAILSSSPSLPAAPSSSAPTFPASQTPSSSSTFDPLTLDHQQRWFTGWGSSPLSHSHFSPENLKTPALGLVWANQIACRIALVKEPVYATAPLDDGPDGRDEDGGRGELVRWRRWMKVVFAPWVEGEEKYGKGVEFEIRGEGIRSVGAR